MVSVIIRGESGRTGSTTSARANARDFHTGDDLAVRIGGLPPHLCGWGPRPSSGAIASRPPAPRSPPPPSAPPVAGVRISAWRKSKAARRPPGPCATGRPCPGRHASRRIRRSRRQRRSQEVFAWRCSDKAGPTTTPRDDSAAVSPRPIRRATPRRASSVPETAIRRDDARRPPAQAGQVLLRELRETYGHPAEIPRISTVEDESATSLR
jgi:hypothetical protein